MHFARWLPLLVIGVAGACGGHTDNTDTGSPDRAAEATDVGGSGASTKQGGPSAAGKTAGRAGATSPNAGSPSRSSGGDGSAGEPTASMPETAGAGGSCDCEPDMICEPGYVVSQDPSKCCRCVVDCLSVGCLELDCPAGSHEAQDDYECCPSCVADQPLTCAQAREKYEQRRGELMASIESMGCTDDADCTYFWEDNRCDVTCGTPLPLAGRDAIEDELDDFAEQSCTNCPQEQPIECPRPLPSTCVDSVCQ
jgi:hypothetical protein